MRGNATLRSVSRRWALAPLAALPLGAVLLLARGEVEPVAAVRAISLPPAVSSRPIVAAPCTRSIAAPSEPTPPTPDLAATLARADEASAREAYLATLVEPAALRDRALVQRLLARAADPRATVDGRVAALDLVRRAPDVDAATVAAIGAIVGARELDDATRAAAIDALRQLADRADLEPPLRAALLDAAEKAPNAEARAFAVEAIAAAKASDDELARAVSFLRDSDARVREAAARALASSPLRARALVADEVARALERETDASAAARLIDAALFVGRADADALLARAQAARVVGSEPALSRRVVDYRAALGAGETDPLRIARAHEESEASRLAAERERSS